MKISHLNPHLESVLERQLTLSKKKIEVVGTNSPLSLSFLLAQSYSKKINELPHLIITASLEDAEILRQHFKTLHCPKEIHLLTFHDVSPYSTLIPNDFVAKKRIGWLHEAAQAKPGEIFIAPIQALQQKTLPFNFLHQASFKINEGSEIPPHLSKTLEQLGYQASPFVEDPGQYALRGGIIDLFSPSHDHPIRIELFGDLVESIRLFSSETQRTIKVLSEATIIPAHEVIYDQVSIETVLNNFQLSLKDRTVNKEEVQEILHGLTRHHFFPSIDFMLPFFYQNPMSPLEHFSSPLHIWFLDSLEIQRTSDLFTEEMKADFENSASLTIRPHWNQLFNSFDQLPLPPESTLIHFNRITLNHSDDITSDSVESISYPCNPLTEFASLLQGQSLGSEPWLELIKTRLHKWRLDDYVIFIFGRNHQQAERLKYFLERADFTVQTSSDDEFLLEDWALWQKRDPRLIHILPSYLNESLRWVDEKIIFLRDDDFFGSKSRLKKSQSPKEVQKQFERLSFGDLNPGDFVVHIKHGIGKYEGLKVMPVNGIDSEFIQIAYKDADKLYLPVYRIGQLQKYSSGIASVSVDKLGGTSWEKAKIKVKGHLKDVANELLQLYALRAQLQRPPFSPTDNDFATFESAFPYEETQDQLRAI